VNVPDESAEPDLVDVLTSEHRTVEGLFADIETTSDRALRRDALDAAIAALKRHSDLEERYLHPTTRERLEAGEVLAAHEEREHADAQALIERIGDLPDNDPELDPLLSTLMSDVRYHVQEEETELFPRLRAACQPGELRRLGEDASRS
jgi:hemerythrin superfamily protein